MDLRTGEELEIEIKGRHDPCIVPRAVPVIEAAAALARVLFSIAHYQSLLPLTTYNALFVPMFAMGGLLCLVMSALFRQAAEIKAENDLTI